MTEIFESLAMIGDPVSEEDRVVQILASLPESFNMLVTTLEANLEVPSMETVTERLLHEERKIKGREETGTRHTKAMMARNSFGQKKKFTYYYCGKPGHFKRNCQILASDVATSNEKKDKSGCKTKRKATHKANKATSESNDINSSSSEDDALVVCHALSARSKGNWIRSRLWCNVPYVQ